MSKFFISDLFKNIILKFLPSINLIQGSLDKKKQFEQKINYLGRFVVNAVLLRVRPHMYQSRYNPSAVNIKQNIIHTATIQWTIQRHYTGRDLVCYVNQTIAIYWSMSQTEHDSQGHNPVNYQRHYTGRDLVFYINQTISIDQCLKQDTIHTATIQWTINTTITGRDLVFNVNRAISIDQFQCSRHDLNSCVSTKP